MIQKTTICYVVEILGSHDSEGTDCGLPGWTLKILVGISKTTQRHNQEDRIDIVVCVWSCNEICLILFGGKVFFFSFKIGWYLE
jgi:hypothetical protein